jgi:uncharacterized protein (TIGR02145 family)
VNALITIGTAAAAAITIEFWSTQALFDADLSKTNPEGVLDFNHPSSPAGSALLNGGLSTFTDGNTSYFRIINNGTATSEINFTIDFTIVTDPNNTPISPLTTLTLPASGTIKIVPRNTILRDPLGGSNIQILLVGTAIDEIIYNTTGATGAAITYYENSAPGTVITGLPNDLQHTSLVLNPVGDEIRIWDIINEVGEFIYTVTLTGGCGNVSAMGSINVHSCPQEWTDDIGDRYNVVPLAGRCWYRENVYSTTYQDGTPFPNGATPLWYDSPMYGNELAMVQDFGYLYTYDMVFNITRSGKTLCPDGWSIPTQDEWALLTPFDLNLLKNTNYWLQPNHNTNALDFDMRGAGIFNSTHNRFENLYGYTAWWALDDSPSPMTEHATGAFAKYYCSALELGPFKVTDALSVRCIMNKP